MSKTSTIAAILLLAIAAAAGWYYLANDKAASSQSVSNADDAAIRAMVTEFGGQMQKVSLLAPETQRKAEMGLYYAAYVSPGLLAAWYPEGAEGALGRYTSSPWPERIEVVSVTAAGNTAATVEANVIEVANTASSTQLAAVYPVTFTVKKEGNQWKIAAAQKGAYSEVPQRRAITGLWECLPHKNQTGPQTTECAFGIAVDQSDGHYAVNTSLMSTYPVDFATGTHVRIEGIVVPANQLSSDGWQKYDIDGVISATTIIKID